MDITSQVIDAINGWLQSLADGVKLIQKEDLVPKDADALLFRMAPFMVCIASFANCVFAASVSTA